MTPWHIRWVTCSCNQSYNTYSTEGQLLVNHFENGLFQSFLKQKKSGPSFLKCEGLSVLFDRYRGVIWFQTDACIKEDGILAFFTSFEKMFTDQSTDF